MVVAGVHEGKNEICARIGYFNYGINLKTERPTPGQVKAAIHSLLTNPAYKSNVARLAEEMDGYDTYPLFERYLKQVLHTAGIISDQVSGIGAKLLY
jgi:UDP:flavonoid glycosyltransferase YjiC (YdhE family)